MNEGMITVPWVDGMRPGGGYDSLYQVVKGLAAADAADLTLNPVVSPYQNSIEETKRIETTTDLVNNLSISATVSGGYGGFSASATASYEHDTHVNNYSLFFLTSVKAWNGEKQVKKMVLADGAKTLSPDQFRSKFGDYFVQGVLSGGIFYSLLEMVTDSEETKEIISVSVEAKYEGAFSAGAKFKSDIENAATHKGVKVNTYTAASGAEPQWSDGRRYDTFDDIATAVSSFAASVGNAGEPLYAILSPYSVLLDAPDVGIDTSALDATRQSLLTIYLNAKQVLNSLDYALANPSQFSPDQVKKMATVRQQAIDSIQKVAQIDHDLKANPQAEVHLPEPLSLELIPQRMWGGTAQPIAPPATIVPAALDFKLGYARSVALRLDNGPLRTACLTYLDQVRNDVLANVGNAQDFVQAISSTMSSFGNNIPADEAQQLAANLADLRDTGEQSYTDAIAVQNERFAQLGPNTDGKLDFLTKNLNPYIWNINDPQYAGIQFWKKLTDTTTLVSTIAKMMGSTSNPNERFSFASGMWKLLGESFHQAMIEIAAPPVGELSAGAAN
jgi:hypothetical protein